MLSVVVDDQHGDGLHFKKLSSLNFSKCSNTSLRQNQKCTMDYSSCKEMIDVLVLSLILIVLAGKQQNAVTELL